MFVIIGVQAREWGGATAPPSRTKQYFGGKLLDSIKYIK